MTTSKERSESRNPTRILAAIMLVLMTGIGYAVEGATDIRNAAVEEEAMEADYLASDCVAGGLAFSGCLIDD